MKKVKKIRKRIKKVQKATGYSFIKVVCDMKKAKRLGLSSYEYVKFKVWKLNEEKRKLLVDKLNKEKSRKELVLSKISELTGKDKTWVKTTLNEAEKRGISNADYLKYRCFELSDKEIEELIKALENKKENRKSNNEWYINVIMEKSGWSRKETLEKTALVRSKGYNYRKFVTSGLYSRSKEELENVGPYVRTHITTTDEERQKAAKTLAKYKKIIMKEKKWNEGEFLLNYLKAYNNCGCSYSEYYLYNLYNLSDVETRKYITQDLHLKMQLRYCEYNDGLNYFENKSLFNKTFKDFVHRRWFTNDDLTFEDFKENIKGLDEIIYKPMDNLGGEGIKKFKVNTSPKTNKEVYNKIMAGGPAIVEECIVQNEEIAKFWPKTVNSIRIMTLVKNGKVNFLNSVIKFGTGKYADNLAQGGIAAGIDIKKGIICTDGVNKKGEVFEVHPNSKVKFKGFKIPHWNKVLKECEKAAKVVKEMPYIGWDITITNEGNVEIIEGNHNQAGFLVQYPYAILEHKGKRDTIEPYLWFDKK